MAARDPTSRLPAGIERAWGRRPLSRKGPKPGLDLEGIVAVAASLAQADGLGAVSMSRVAAALGVSTMALYGYVDTKDELFALMVDHACGPPPEPSAPGKGWRDELAQWAVALFSVYLQHPWAARIPTTGVPPTPNQVAWLEAGLDCLATTGLTVQQKLSTVLLMSVFTRSEANLALDLAEARQHGAAPGQSVGYGEMIRALIDPHRFPAVWAALSADAFENDVGVDGEFRFGLERILDGIANLLRAPDAAGDSQA